MEIYENSCRVCLSNVELIIPDEKIYSLDEKEIGDDYNLTICDKITLVTGIIINSQGSFAKKICETCRENLRIAFNFRKICISSDSVLKRFAAKQREYEISSFQSEADRKALQNFNIIEATNLTSQQTQIKEENRNISNNDESSETQELESENERSSDNSTEHNIIDSNYTSLSQCDGDDQLQFLCELCGNAYEKKSSLIGHMRWHSGQKTYQCEKRNGSGRKYSSITLAQREILIKCYLDGNTVKESAKISGIKLSTASSIIETYRRNGGVLIMKKCGGRTHIKMTSSILNRIGKIIKENSYTTLKDVRDKIFEYENVKLSLSTVKSGMIQLGITKGRLQKGYIFSSNENNILYQYEQRYNPN